IAGLQGAEQVVDDQQRLAGFLGISARGVDQHEYAVSMRACVAASPWRRQRDEERSLVHGWLLSVSARDLGVVRLGVGALAARALDQALAEQRQHDGDVVQADEDAAGMGQRTAAARQ